MFLEDMNIRQLKDYILGMYAIPLEKFTGNDGENLTDAKNILLTKGVQTIFIREGHIRFYHVKEDDDDCMLHICKFCDCFVPMDDGHACQEFTDAANAPDGTLEHELWEAVMNGVDTGFLNEDGSEE